MLDVERGQQSIPCGRFMRIEWGALPVCAALKGRLNLSSGPPSGSETDIVGAFGAFASGIALFEEVARIWGLSLSLVVDLGSSILVRPLKALLSTFIALHSLADTGRPSHPNFNWRAQMTWRKVKN